MDIEGFLRLAAGTPVVDVRSPGEFAQGHIPGAVNLPLFDDEERKQVGTLYRVSGRQAALLLGLDIAGRKMKTLAAQALRIAEASAETRVPGNPARGTSARSGDAGQPDLLVHCWRGGMRSRSMGWLFQQVDLSTGVLAGGYKSWRRYCQRLFAKPWKLMVLGGLTGSGKTELLARIVEKGEQVIDLEGLANHRGSAFGGVGLGPQPTVEHFENQLAERLRQLDPAKRIWIESESQSIGRVYLPGPFFQQAVAAPMVEIEVPRGRRVELLVECYSQAPPSELAAALQRIRKRLGGQHWNEAMASIESGDYARCVDLCLNYYDKSYSGGKYKSGRREFVTLPVPDPRATALPQQLITAADALQV